MPIPELPNSSTVEASSLTVANYRFPAVDGAAGEAIITDGVGNLSFGAVSGSGGVLGGGSGVDNRIARWDGSVAIQSSAVTLDDSGNLTGIVNITASGTAILSGLTYPSTDGASGTAIITDGAGNLSFGAVSLCGGVQGAGVGVDNRVTRWDGSVAIQSSAVTLDDSGNLTGIVNINASGTAILTGLTYPVADGASGNAIITDGAGTLSFGSVSLSGGVQGAGVGVDNRVTRWDGSVAIQSSAVTLDDSGNLTGIVNINASGTAILTGLTYPILDGSAGMTIVTNGAGVLSFAFGLSNAGSLIAPSLDNRLTRYDGTTNLQGSNITVDDSNNMIGNIFSIQSTGSTFTSETSGTIIISSTGGTINNSVDSSIIASENSSIIGTPQEARFSTIVASRACIIDHDNGDSDFIAASISSSINSFGVQIDDSTRNAIIASSQSNILGGILNGSIIASNNCIIGLSGGTYQFQSIIGCDDCQLNDTSGTTLRAVILASTGIDSNTIGFNNVVFGGVTTRNWLLNSNTGELMGSAFTVANPVPDYAEYFENHVKGNAIPYGTLVALEGDKVRVATASDAAGDILGVVSSNPALKAGGCELHWQGAHLRNDWNQLVFEDVPETSWRPGPGQTESDRPTNRQPKINPDYKPNESVYVDRGKRPKEWTCVGMLGQILTRVDDTVSAMDYVAPGTVGVSTKSLTRTKVRCMRLHRSNLEEGGKTYNIALCLLN
jgi:hypothetical protein